MNIDERLAALTGRHEALAQSVEMMLHGLNEMGVRLDEMGGHIDRLVTAQEKNQVLMADVLESIQGLSRIAHLHHERISRLENNN